MRIIGGTHRGRKLASPAGGEVRPSTGTLREALFNICRNHIEGAHFLDLFAGTGAVGLEALSRGASRVTFVDKGRNAIQCLKKNIESLEFEERSEVVSGDVLSVLYKLSKKHPPFDIIFADPPYSKEESTHAYPSELLKIIDGSNLIAPGGIVFIEDSSLNKELESDVFLRSLSVLKLQSKRKYGHSYLWEFRPASIHIESPVGQESYR